MATIIDALIVTLGLDAKKFSDGSKDAQASLDATTRAAEKAAEDQAKAAERLASDKEKAARKEAEAAKNASDQIAEAARKAAEEQVKAADAAKAASDRAVEAAKEAAQKTAEADKLAAAAKIDASQQAAAGQARAAAATALANAKVAQSVQNVAVAQATQAAQTAAAAQKNYESHQVVVQAANERLRLAADEAAARAADVSKQKAEVQERVRQERQKRDEEAKSAKESEERNKAAAEGYRKVRNEVFGLLALFTAGRGIKDFVRDITSSDAAAGRMANQIGMSVQELSAWQEAVQRTGGSAQALDGTLDGLAQQFQEFKATNQSGLIPFLQQINLQFSQFIDKQGNFHPEQLLLAFASRVKELNLNPAQASNIGRGLGIDQGTINLLLKGRDGVEEMLKKARDLGVTTEKDAENAQKLSTAFLNVKQAVTSAARVVLNELSPYITDALDFVTDWVSKPENQKWFADQIVKDVRMIKDGIVEFIGQADRAAQAVGGWKTATELLFGLWLGAKFLGVMANVAKFGAAVALAGGSKAPPAPGGPGIGGLAFLTRVLAPLALLATVGAGTGGDQEHGTEDEQVAKGLAKLEERNQARARGQSDYLSQDAGEKDRITVSAGELTPEEVLKTIQMMPMGSLAGKNVALNTGLQNDPSQTDAVEEQIAALKARGAKEVKIVGVNDQLIEANEHLAEIALKLGTGFGAHQARSAAASGQEEPQQTWWQKLLGIPATAPEPGSSDQAPGRGGEGVGGLPPSTAPAPDNVTQTARRNEAIEFYMSKGLPRFQAAALAARMKLESGFDPNAVGDKGQAAGDFQWHRDRRMAIHNGSGINVVGASHRQQLEASWWELNNTEKNALDKLKATKTPEEAGRSVSRDYIRPGLTEAAKAAEAERTAALARRYTNESVSSTVPGAKPETEQKPADAKPTILGVPIPDWMRNLPKPSASPASTSRVSSSETHFHGDMNIQTAATDSDGIASGIRDSIRRNNVVPNANVGLA